MLVLTRKPQERIQIGDSITLTVVRVQGQSVRIGIEAPQEVAIRRGELVEFKPDEFSDEPLPAKVGAEPEKSPAVPESPRVPLPRTFSPQPR